VADPAGAIVMRWMLLAAAIGGVVALFWFLLWAGNTELEDHGHGGPTIGPM
jgi:hypothetical protein